MHCHSILYVFSACSSSFELDQQQRSGILLLRIFSLHVRMIGKGKEGLSP